MHIRHTSCIFQDLSTEGGPTVFLVFFQYDTIQVLKWVYRNLCVVLCTLFTIDVY